MKEIHINNKIRIVLSSLLAGFALTYKPTEALPFWAYGEVSRDFVIARIFSCLGEYQFQFVAASLLAGCGIYLIRKKFSKNLKGYILPLICGFIVMFGRHATSYGNVSGLWETFPLILRTVLAAIGYGVIFRYLFALFEGSLEIASATNCFCKKAEKFFGEHAFRNVLVLLLLLWLPIMILNYPGNYNADFLGQLLQSTGDMPWSTHHPILLTAIIGMYFGLFKAIFGNYDVALFSWIMIQAFFFASALALTISFLKKKNASTLMMTVVLGVYVLAPIYSNIATTAIKDVPFASACIWYCVLVVQYYEDKDAFLKNTKNLLKICLAAFLVCMCRNNGIFIVFANGLVMCIQGLKTSEKRFPAFARKVLLFLLVPVGVYALISFGIKTGTKAESDGLKEVLSVPMQQTALCLVRHENGISAKDKENINALFGSYENLKENYNPFISDPVKQFYDTDASFITVREYFKTWGRMFVQYPGTYLESFFLSTYGWFDIGCDTAVRYEFDSIYFPRHGLFEGANGLIVYLYRFLNNISFFGFLQSPGLWTWVMFILLRRNKNRRRLYPMQIITLLVCMAGPCFMKHARYAFPIMFTMPFLMGYEGTTGQHDTTEKNPGIGET